MSLKIPKVIRENRYRYLSFLAGFLLFVGPFAILARIVYFLTSNIASPTLHTMCFRMPIDWFFGGRMYMLLGSVAAGFILSIGIVSFFLGPVFCGWFCPVGSVSEVLSRVIPIPSIYRIRIQTPQVTAGARYGFFLGFIAVAAIAGYKLSSSVSNVCCRYCTSSVLQNSADALFGNVGAVSYWHSGSLITLISWLLIGGIFMSGGRGWCLFFCPLGAVSGLAHRAGARLGMYSISFHEDRCNHCETCSVNCPVWAVKQGGGVEKTLCISCRECVHACPHGSFSYGRGEKP